MKKIYQNPEIEFKSFESADVVTFSVAYAGSGDEMDYGEV